MPDPAAPTTTEPVASEPTTTATEPAQAEPPKEIDWQAEARKWEGRAKANKKALDEAAPKLQEYETLRNASQTDLERATEQASRWQQDSEKWRSAAIASRVQALAADFADPTDAVGALSDPAKYLTAGGEIDDAAIRSDLASVLEQKPHWRRQEAPAGPRAPLPSRAQGAQPGSADDPNAQFAAFLTGQLQQG